MSCIVNNFQTILVCDVLDCLGIAWFAINMNRHNSGGTWCDGRLNLVRIHIACCRVYIYKDRLASVPPDTMGCCHEAIRGCDNFACNAEGLQCRHQWQGTIGEQAHVWHFEIFCQCLFQLLVEASIIGNPLTLPNLLQLCSKIVKIWKKWRCYCY